MAYLESKAYSEFCQKSIYQEIFYSKPCVTLTYSEPLLYSEPWCILKSKHIQNSAEYLRWSILLRTLCNYGRFRGPIYCVSAIFCVSVSLMYLLFFGTTEVSVSTNENMGYSLATLFFSHSLVYELNGSS